MPALDKLDERVESRLRSRNYREALELIKQVPEETLATSFGQARVAAAEQRIREQARAQLDQELKEFRELLGREQIEAAWRRANQIANWALDEALLDKLKEEVLAARTARHDAVRELGTDEGYPARAGERWLQNELKGWSKHSRIYRGGGTLLSYEDPSSGLLDDLEWISGPKLELTAIPRVGEKGIKLAGSQGPVIVRLPLKMSLLLDASLELMVEKAPGPNAEIAIVVGMDHRGRSGSGLSWGQFPVKLEREGLTRVVAKRRFSGLRPLVAHRLRVSASGEGVYTALSGYLMDLGNGTSQKGTGRADRSTQGYVGIVAQGIDVYLRAVEVRGIPDPSQFQ